MTSTISRRDAVLGAATVAVAATVATAAQADQKGHLQAALDQLQKAHKQLDAAGSGLGGHRGKAMRATEQAIAETKQAMRFISS
ncbi:MAG: hypothetical protein ROR55_20550 [Devosia sp.]